MGGQATGKQVSLLFTAFSVNLELVHFWLRPEELIGAVLLTYGNPAASWEMLRIVSCRPTLARRLSVLIHLDPREASLLSIQFSPVIVAIAVLNDYVALPPPPLLPPIVGVLGRRRHSQLRDRLDHSFVWVCSGGQ